MLFFEYFYSRVREFLEQFSRIFHARLQNYELKIEIAIVFSQDSDKTLLKILTLSLSEYRAFVS